MQSLGDNPAAWLTGAAGVAVTFVLGVVSGRAQLRTAGAKARDTASLEADRLLGREAAVIERQEKRIQLLEDRESRCQAALLEVREQLAVLRVAAQLPPYEFKVEVEPPASAEDLPR